MDTCFLGEAMGFQGARQVLHRRVKKGDNRDKEMSVQCDECGSGGLLNWGGQTPVKQEQG